MAIARPLYGPGPEEPSPLRPVRDLAGTPVVDARGRHAGTVYGTLADARSGLIRYLDLALDESDRHVLVPLGHTRVTTLADRTEIELRAATREELRGIPPYEPHEQEPDGEYQRSVLAAHGRLFHGERYYAHPAYDHSGLYAGDHPLIRGQSIPEPEAPLQRLTEMPDYRVAEGEADIRGWPLADAHGRRVGTLEDLIIDPGAEKVRYALVRAEGRETDLIPVPIGYLRIDADERLVASPALERADIEAIPAYEPEAFDRAEEERILETIESRLEGERYFDRPDFSRGDGIADPEP